MAVGEHQPQRPTYRFLMSLSKHTLVNMHLALLDKHEQTERTLRVLERDLPK